MSSVPSFGSEPPPKGLLHKNERNRLILMTGLLVVVAGVFVTAVTKKKQYEQGDTSQLPPTGEAEEEFVESVLVPEFDVALITGQVADAQPDGRVLFESAPFDALYAFAREYGDSVFRGGAGTELDAQGYDALVADPEAHRALPYRVRGTIEEAKPRIRLDDVEEVRGWLTLEDGRHVAFAVEELGEKLGVGSFVRLDGFFLKLFRAELGETWVEGPMFVGPGAIKTYPAPPAVFDPEDLEVALAQVSDDSFEAMTKLDDAALKAQWLLVDRVRRPDVAEPDWEHPMLLDEKVVADMVEHPEKYEGKVFELTNVALAQLHKSPEVLRGRPFHLPISKNMGSKTATPGENHARLDALTTGWIGNMSWTSNTGLVQYVMPGAVETVRDASFVTGRGYFLKKLAYAPNVGDLALAPLFVMDAIEPFVPPKDRSVQNFLWIMVLAFGVMAALIPILLVRDRRRAAQLQQELVRRRQERRRRRGAETPIHPAG